MVYSKLMVLLVCSQIGYLCSMLRQCGIQSNVNISPQTFGLAHQVCASNTNKLIIIFCAVFIFYPLLLKMYTIPTIPYYVILK